MTDSHKPPIQLSWQDRCKAVAQYHASRCKVFPDHTLAMTADELNRSIGRISEDLQLASWMKHNPRVEKFKTTAQALDYIRTKKREMRIADA